jgi:hypothetical protein
MADVAAMAGVAGAATVPSRPLQSSRKLPRVFRRCEAECRSVSFGALSFLLRLPGSSHYAVPAKVHRADLQHQSWNCGSNPASQSSPRRANASGGA